MIYLLTAPPGGGKSFYAVRAASRALEEGKPVAGNLELRSDWPEQVVRHNPAHWIRRGARRRFLDRAPDRYHFSEDLQELARLRLRGDREGRGLMVLDEAHNWMNARSWSGEDRKWIVRLFSQHRKLGWDIALIAQHAEMIDKQVRNLVEYNVQLRNMKKAKVAGVPISPVDFFLAIWQWHSAQRVIVKREAFPLSWRRRLYDTDALSHGLTEDDDEAIWLPSSPADRGQVAAPAHGRTRPGAAARATAAPELSTEAADEAGEPEAWEAPVDYSRER